MRSLAGKTVIVAGGGNSSTSTCTIPVESLPHRCSQHGRTAFRESDRHSVRRRSRRIFRRSGLCRLQGRDRFLLQDPGPNTPARELARRNVPINCLYPDPTGTNLFRAFAGDSEDGLTPIAGLGRAIPMRDRSPSGPTVMRTTSPAKSFTGQVIHRPGHQYVRRTGDSRLVEISRSGPLPCSAGRNCGYRRPSRRFPSPDARR